jgi:hypothetical protein
MSIIPQFFMEATVALGRNTKPAPQWCATGFVVGRYEGTQDSTDKFSTYLITNKHVVDNESEMVMQVNLLNGVKTYLLEFLDKDNVVKFSTHPDDDVIACHININLALSEGARLPFFDLRNHALTLQQMRDTGVCEGGLAYTLGFPVSIASDFVNSTVKTPICRMGCISRVENVYHGSSSKNFLIDATTYPGNSGGPVISRPENLTITNTPHNTSANLIGLVSAYLPYRETLCSTQTHRPRVVNEENSGLTVVVSVDSIKEVVEIERTRAYGIPSDDSTLDIKRHNIETPPIEIPACVE